MRPAAGYPSSCREVDRVKIDSIEAYYVAMPLKYPWRTAYGEDYDIHSILVKAVSEGYSG